MLLVQRDTFAGVSCLSASGDYDYPQAPLQAVYSSESISQEDERKEEKRKAFEVWQSLKATAKNVDYDEIVEHEDKTEIMQTVACGGGACDLV